MTFKWTYLFVAAVALAGIVLTWIAGGPVGAYGHFYGIALIGIAAAIVLVMYRRQTHMSNVMPQHEPFAGYPKGQVLGIVDTTDAASEALADLVRSGFAAVELTVYAGTEGAARLDAQGTAHGLGAVVERSLEHLLSDVGEMVDGYDDAVQRAGVVIAVRASSDDRRRRALEAFRRHGAHDIYSFGAMTVERLDVDPGRVTKSPIGEAIREDEAIRDEIDEKDREIRWRHSA